MNRAGKDRKVYEELIRFLDRKRDSSAESTDQLLLDIGKFFLGTPYRVDLLEEKGAEHFVVNLREFDCATFVENMIALAWHIASGKKSFPAFQRLLRKIRYRQGRLEGYPSRLHYFSDWIRDNQKKGILKDVTAEIGGRPLKKALTFMTAHLDLYPPLKNEANFRKMRSIERTISRRRRYFIAKKSLTGLEDGIRDGDLIAITTEREGLDIQHVGLAARVNHRIHLLHASSSAGGVVFSEKTLYRYLMESRDRSGITVARLSRTCPSRDTSP